MPTVGQLVVNLLGNAKPFMREVQSAQSSVASLRNSIVSAAAVTSAIGAATKAVSLAASYESTEVAFTVMLKSASEAKRVLGDLAQFSATTPFQLPEVESAAKQLIGYGFAAKEVVPTLRQLGDISAALKVPLNDLIYLYGTSSTQAHLFARDIQQFSGRGIPIIAELAKVLKVAKDDVMHLVETGQVNFGHLQQAITNMTSAGGQFENVMESASKTLEGRWSNLQDAITLALRDIGVTMIQTFDIKGIVEDAIGFVASMQSAIHEYGSAVLMVVGIIAGMAAGIIAARVAIMAYNAALGMFTAVQSGATIAAAMFRVVTDPTFLIQLAAGVLGATVMMNMMYESVTASANSFNQVSSAATQATSAVAGFNQAASATKVDLQKLPGELQKQIEIIRNLNQQDAGQAKLSMPQAYRNKYRNNAIASIDQLTAASQQTSGWTAEVKALWEAYGLVLDAQEQVTDHKFSLQGIEDQIGKLTGVSEEIEKIKDQIHEIQVGSDEAKQDKFFAAGATPSQMQELKQQQAALKQAQAQQKHAEESQQAAKSLYENTRTPIEKFESEVARLKKLKDEGAIDDDLYGRGIAAAKKELKSPQKKSSDEPLNAVAARSVEAQQVVLRAMKGAVDPNKSLEAEAKKTNSILADIKAGINKQNATKNAPHVQTLERI